MVHYTKSRTLKCLFGNVGYFECTLLWHKVYSRISTSIEPATLSPRNSAHHFVLLCFVFAVTKVGLLWCICPYCSGFLLFTGAGTSMRLSQGPVLLQLSLKAALPLAKIPATASHRSSTTGPTIFEVTRMWVKSIGTLAQHSKQVCKLNVLSLG